MAFAVAASIGATSPKIAWPRCLRLVGASETSPRESVWKLSGVQVGA